MSALAQIDFYKTDHRRQYPKGTELVYSNFTARSNKYAPRIPGYLEPNWVVFFGLQYFIIDYLIDEWNKTFFLKNREVAVGNYKQLIDRTLGPDSFPVDHLYDLHALGFLPIEIRALPEGTRVPIGVPMLTVHNTRPEFFWLTNYLETVMSAELWKPCTTATIADMYRYIVTDFCERTGGIKELLPFQCHDFSFRGMSGRKDAAISGMGHLLSFAGTDTVPAILTAEEFYGAIGLVGTSVPATEHSVMSMGTKEEEVETFRRLITELYPKGIVSIVSDTWDFWKVITEYAPRLKNEILARDGKVVFRPDSGDPESIICGTELGRTNTARGALRLLWDAFGGDGTTSYKHLHPRVGLIYGDSITIERAFSILRHMEQIGFASTNVVFGIGSYTYQHITRDVYGMAMKATYGVVNGEPRVIYKDPVTDDGTKKSLRGLIRVLEDPYYGLYAEDGFDSFSNIDGDASLLKPVFRDGALLDYTSFSQIRERLSKFYE